MTFNRYFSCCLCLLIGILPPLSIFGQKKPSEPSKPSAVIAPTAYIKLATGEELIAKVLSKDSSEIQILVVGTDELRRIEVQNITTIRAVSPKTILSRNYDFSNRDAFSNTALALKKREGFYQNSMLGYNAAYWGITDRFTLGGGTVLFGILDGSLPIWAHAKYSYSFSQYIHVGANFLALQALAFDDFNDPITFLAAWGNMTIGDRNNNFTVGWGRRGDSDVGLFNNNMTQISGQLRLGKRWALLGGGWFFQPRNNPISIFSSFAPRNFKTDLYSLTARYMVRRSAWELSVLHCPIARSFEFGDFTVPTLSYVRRW